MARSADPMPYVAVVGYVYFAGIPFGVLRPDDCAVREIEDALQVAERSGDDLALALAGMTLGFALVHGSVNAQAAVLSFMARDGIFSPCETTRCAKRWVQHWPWDRRSRRCQSGRGSENTV